MKVNKDIWVVTMDLGYKMWDQIRDDFPDRFINVGAAEQAGMGIACGLALEGKIPFVYSITSFLLYRPFETIRTYINHEKINVKLVGSGRGADYHVDGFSHFAGDDEATMKLFPNIVSWWPVDKEMIPNAVKAMVKNGKPTYINLKR